MNEPTSVSGLGAVILCGGQSSRMGFPKHDLWFGEKTFAQSVAESVREVADAVVAVFAHGESPPASLPSFVQVIHDERPDLGPLEGIRSALSVLEPVVPYAFVTSCDVPDLKPNVVRKLFELRGDFDAVVPKDGERVYGMTAIYRTSLHAEIDAIYASGASRRVSALQAMVNTLAVPICELKQVDPNLDSLANINTTDDYFRLLSRYGLSCPEDLADKLSNE